MKHTTTRKKMLLSSVAMLLVAMLALGSATFAWFTANPKADASGLSLKTTASTGLVVRTDSDTTWSHNAVFYKNQSGVFNLTPVSQEQGAGKADKFWTIEANQSNDYAHKTTATMTPVQNIGTTVARVDQEGETITHTAGDLYREKVYFRLSDGSNASDATNKKVVLNGVSIKKQNVTGVNMDGTIRVAVVDKNNNILATFARDNNKANGTLTTANKTPGDFSKLIEVPSTGTETLTLDGEEVIDCTAAGALSTNPSDQSQYVSVYVYLDGQDTDCKSDMVGTVNAIKIIDSIKVNFELVDVPQGP